MMFSFPIFAQQKQKDSFYFMKDDGIFSEEEKDEEAEYIKRRCDISVLEHQYYDCACIAGAYRLRRNEEKLVPQSILLNSLYKDTNSKCVDSAKIAGNVLVFCETYTKYFRSRERQEENKEYCECVANKVANDFSQSPRLRTRYMKSLKIKAMTSCRIRPVK